VIAFIAARQARPLMLPFNSTTGTAADSAP
jgi:hypothetical protein